MIDYKDLLLYKDYYRGHSVIYVTFLGEEFVFRTLSKKEYTFILSLAKDTFEKEDMVCQMSCIYPKDYTFEDSPFAGLNEYVCDTVERISGFLDINDVINEFEYHKAQQDTMENQCKALVKAFIPEYTYEQMETWTWSMLMEISAAAETIAKLKGFDYSLVNRQEEQEEKETFDLSWDNEELVQELHDKGIDPMLYFKDQYQFTQELINGPIIGGLHWQNGEMMNVIGEEIRKTKFRAQYS